MNRLIVSALAVGLAASTHAAEQTYNLNFTGDQEVPGPGDPDGSGTGTVTVNDVTGDISWNINYSDISSVVGFHFHQAPAGSSAGVFLGLDTATTGGPNTLVNSLTTFPATAQAINDNPDQFYLNIHSSEFQPGAIRAQVPEPGSLALLGLGTLVLGRRRRRA